MLVAGMDVSGDILKDNYNYLSIVIGTVESIDSLSRVIGLKRMANSNHKQRNRIIKKLDFDQRNRIAFCIKLDRNRIIQEVESKRTVRRNRIPRAKIFRTFNHIVIHRVIPRIQSYALEQNEVFTDLRFECDSDCQPFARAGTMRISTEGKAHSIADKVAWCNNRSKAIQSVIEIDFTNDIANTMIRMLNLQQ